MDAESAVTFDAIVLAGGRSARLGGVPKAGLRYAGQTLLGRSLEAVAGARRVVVIGPSNILAVPAGIALVQEDPPFGGPAAAITAGMNELEGSAAAYTLVLACDMPSAAQIVAQLLAAAWSVSTATEHTVADSLVARDGGKLQPLAALHRTAALRQAVDAAGARVQGMSAFRLIASLQVVPVEVRAELTYDVDTWDDARRFGIVPPADEVHRRGDNRNERFDRDS